MSEKEDNRPTGRLLAYDARLKKCASTECWGLNFSVSESVVLPDYKTHVFPLFEHMDLTKDEIAALTAEGLKFSPSIRRLQDPGERLKGVTKMGRSGSRHVGQSPVDGVGGRDTKKKGEVRDQKKKNKEEEMLRKDRGTELVRGKRVRARSCMGKLMQDEAAKGLLYKGTIVRQELRPEPVPEWRFVIRSKGLAGADTDGEYTVTLRRVMSCTCKPDRDMMKRTTTSFVYCKHIYAIMQKVLKFNANDNEMCQVVLNLEELETIFSRIPDLSGLE